MNGKWQRFRFGSPNFVTIPSVASGYAEAKSILAPRFYLAGRVGRLTPGSVLDRKGIYAPEFAPALSSLELAGGFWLNRHQLLKLSYFVAEE